MANINALIELLGEERVEKLKDQLVCILIERIRDDFDTWDKYLFYPPDYEEIIEQAVKEAEKKIRKMYVDHMVNKAKEKIFDNIVSE